MTLVERFIISRSEKHLRRYRDAAGLLQAGLSREYEDYLPQLEACYSAAGYWHGTGLYHYQHPNDSRYESGAGAKIVGVLDTILEQKGLANHQDLWAKEIEKFKVKTVSVAPSRMHARLYAHVHLCEGVWLEYVFGGTRFWMSFFIILAALDSLSGQGREQYRLIRQTVLKASFMRHARIWASAIRNLDAFRILPVWRAYDLRSDIAGNHPVLFGIKKEAALGQGVIPFLSRLEVRIAHPIPLEQFTHIEVPKEHVSATRALLKKHGVSLPVIPLEFGELYCSRMTLTQLAYA